VTAISSAERHCKQCTWHYQSLDLIYFQGHHRGDDFYQTVFWRLMEIQ